MSSRVVVPLALTAAEAAGFFRRREQNVNVTLVGSNLHFLDVAWTAD